MNATDIILVVITLFMCAIGFWGIIRDFDDHASEQGMEFSKWTAIYSGIMVVITLGIAVWLCIFYEENSLLFNLKRMALLSLLWPIAYIDFKSYRIPNFFIILGFGYRILILMGEVIMESNVVWPMFLSECIAAAALFVAAILCSICIKDSIGFGDIKLFIIMGLLLGLNSIWSAIFMSLIVSFFISVYVLLTKKKTRKDSIPFGPAIMIGTYISVFFMGM